MAFILLTNLRIICISSPSKNQGFKTYFSFYFEEFNNIATLVNNALQINHTDIFRVYFTNREIANQFIDKNLSRFVRVEKSEQTPIGSIPLWQIYLFRWAVESGSYSLMRYVSSKLGCSPPIFIAKKAEKNLLFQEIEKGKRNRQTYDKKFKLSTRNFLLSIVVVIVGAFYWLKISSNNISTESTTAPAASQTSTESTPAPVDSQTSTQSTPAPVDSQTSTESTPIPKTVAKEEVVCMYKSAEAAQEFVSNVRSNFDITNVEIEARGNCVVYKWYKH